jgi:serine/threonine protein kinase/TPR repeat protein
MELKEFRERYQYDAVRDLLGQGAFGRVFRARDTLLDRQVALKIFSRDVPERYDLIREISRAIGLNHPNICRYYGAEVLRGANLLGEAQEIQVGVMELVEGGTVDAFLTRNPQHRKKLLGDVLRGLSYLHGHRPPIIHRDLKPPNVLVDLENGQPVAKITDFGISRSADQSGSGPSTVGVGTYAYMAPEQLNPTRYGVNGKMQCNLDLWAFGAMTIELLTGALPFGGNAGDSTGQIMEAIVRGIPPQVLNGFEEPYRRVLARCMVQDAGRRAQTADELLSLLEAAQASPAGPRRQQVVDDVWKHPPTVVEEPAARHESQARPMPEPPPRRRTVVEPEPAPRRQPAPPSKPKESAPPSQPRFRQGTDAASVAAAKKTSATEIWKERLRAGMMFILSLFGILMAAVAIGNAVDDGGFDFIHVFLLGAGVIAVLLALPLKRRRFLLGVVLFNLPFVYALAFWSKLRLASGMLLAMEAGCFVVYLAWRKLPKLAAVLIFAGLAACAAVAVQAEFSVWAWAFLVIDTIVCLLFVLASFRPGFRRKLTPNAQFQLGYAAAPLFLVAAAPIAMYLAASLGDRSASQWLGDSYLATDSEARGFARDAGRGLPLVTKSCDRNYLDAGAARACDRLGRLYRYGSGVNKDYGEAAWLFTQSCSTGFAAGCEDLGDLGDLYRNGSGIAKDEGRAGSLYAQACNTSNIRACRQLYSVAYDFANGNGVAKDLEKAAGFYTTSCKGGDAAACTNLGVQYEKGEGVQKDLVKSTALAEKACTGGDNQGCSNLGNNYYWGQGVAQDKAKGKELLQKGCGMGNQWGCDRLKEMQ